MQNKIRNVCGVVVAVLAIGLLAAGAEAVTKTWDGGGGTGSWGTGNNWNPNGAQFGNTVDIVFNNAGANTYLGTSGNRVLRSLTYTSLRDSNGRVRFNNNNQSGGGATAGNLRFQTNANLDANINVNAGATGNIDLGRGGAAVFGNMILAKPLNINHNGTGALTISARIVDEGQQNIEKNGPGLTIFSGNNNYDGRTDVRGGVLRIANNNALGTTNGIGHAFSTDIAGGSNTSRVELAGGITTSEQFYLRMRSNANAAHISNFSGSNTITRQIFGWQGGAYNSIESAGTGAGDLLTLSGGFRQHIGTGTRRWRLMGAGDGRVTGVISNGSAGALELTKTGTGTWTLSNNNSFTGELKVEQGTLAITNAGAIDNASQTTVSAGATLDTSALSAYTARRTNLAGGMWNLGSGLNTYVVDAGQNINGEITGTGGLRLQTPDINNAVRIATINTPATYAGNTTIQSVDARFGVRLGVDNGLPTSTVLTMQGANNGSGRPAWFDLQGNSQELAGLLHATRSDSAIINGNAGQAGTLIINNTTNFAPNVYIGRGNAHNNITSFSGTGNNLELVKKGTGTFTLTRNNAYTGPTTVDEGTLLVNGSIVSNVTVNDGATLGGTGNIGGTVTINEGGTVHAGASIGTLGTGDVTWNSNDIAGGLLFELSNVDDTSDLINIDGAFLKGSGSQFLIDLDGGLFGESYILMNFQGTDFVLSDFVVDSDFPAGALELTDNQLRFNTDPPVVTPEPASIALAMLGLGGLVMRRRKNA